MSDRGRPESIGAELSARKRDILRSVISHYVREVRPVSSQMLAEEARMSSATVRNELAALEELGYLHQRHVSGGRVPTDAAYRFLVEELVQQLATTFGQRTRVAHVYQQLGGEVEALLTKTVELLTEMTGYVAWVTMATPPELTIRSINFIEIDTYELLVMLVTGDSELQSRRVTCSTPVAQLELGKLAEALNNYVRGRKLTDVDFDVSKRIFFETVALPETVLTTLSDFFTDLAGTSERVIFGNALRLALEPEFARADALSQVLTTMENEERFVRMLREQLSKRSLTAIIGSENVDPALHEVSLVVADYGTPATGEGTVGVLGPTRLFYERTIPWVRVIGEVLAQTLSEIAAGEARR